MTEIVASAMSEQLVLDDGALRDAVSHLEAAAEQMTRRMHAPLGEVTGVTSLEQRFNEFLCGVSTAKRILGEAAHIGATVTAEWTVASSEIDAGLGHAVNRTALARGGH